MMDNVGNMDIVYKGITPPAEEWNSVRFHHAIQEDEGNLKPTNYLLVELFI